jgi:putative ABC transport system permease protein
MNGSIPPIPIPHLALAFAPVLVVVAIVFRWSVDGRTALYAVTRMLIQLMLIGYVLTQIFAAKNSLVVLGVLAIMLLVASWIAMRPLRQRGRKAYVRMLTSIALGGATTLALVTQGVLTLHPWFSPHYMIPLAGMIFANSMNTVSIAAERFHSELDRQNPYVDARRTALRAALIPITNTLFAVGLVSLPGMMTGQILSGVSPLIAARYQIMVMCMIYGSAGISAACYLAQAKPPLREGVAGSKPE